MKVGILGSGFAAKALGKGFADRGHDVKMGTRSPEKLQEWLQGQGAKGKLSTGSFADAAKHGEVVVLALLGTGTEPALEMAGVANFDGKLVLDATNPLDFSQGMPPGLFVGTSDSLGERVQRKLPRAKVVKCFNTVGNGQMVDPAFDGGPVPMLVAGNDAAAKERTEQILKELGWPGAMDVGGIDGARWLEALVPLWVRAMMQMNTFGHTFKPVGPAPSKGIGGPMPRGGA
ncbi:MAG TPA: NAD(P)-binding domain-containing protein [Candidatus Thermoplasmatota archaeon]|jgi:hypothetical protein|nr:NAD(P)-binding domain-containing protein [Candidatus Thermoplasmatota archaeon]